MFDNVDLSSASGLESATFRFTVECLKKTLGQYRGTAHSPPFAHRSPCAVLPVLRSHYAIVQSRSILELKATCASCSLILHIDGSTPRATLRFSRVLGLPFYGSFPIQTAEMRGARYKEVGEKYSLDRARELNLHEELTCGSEPLTRRLRHPTLCLRAALLI